MKKAITISVVTLAFGMLSFTNITPVIQPSAKYSSGTVISWKTATIDVGEIVQGTPKVIEYEFKNNGKAAVLITTVQGSCGCTATDYTRTPILPGKIGVIKATFNAANKGAFSKTVTVTTNAETIPTVLTLKGIVI